MHARCRIILVQVKGHTSHEKGRRRKGQDAVKVKRRPRFFTAYCDTNGTPYVLSRLDYCNGVYAGLPQKSLHRLQLALQSAARLITGAPIHDHISTVLQQLKWLPISKRCQFKLLVLTFKVLHLQALPYICDLFHWYTPARILRSASTTSLVPNRHKTIRYRKRLIDTSSAALWNGLPDDI